MDRKEILNNYYSEWNEDDRLLSRFGQVEFLTTIRFIEKYLQPGMRILEVGAGTGRYSHYFARKGYHVDAVELVESNIIEFTEKTLPAEKVSIFQGDAIDLCMLQDNTYDLVLHLGPIKRNDMFPHTGDFWIGFRIRLTFIMTSRAMLRQYVS